MFVTIDPTEPEPWLIARVADALRKGGVGVLPTDTIYGLTASIEQPQAIRRIYALKEMDPKKPLSLLLPDVSVVARWARAVTTPAYRLMKRVLPGAYTFILPASREVPKIMLRPRRTIGLRVPDDAITLAVLQHLDAPLLTTSVRTPEDEYVNDPITLDEAFGAKVDVVVDGGPRLSEASTIVDLTGVEPVLVREGKGPLGPLQLFG